MSGFTTEALEKKLSDLNCSQQSIQTLSLWLIHHRKHNKAIVATWFKEIKKAKPARKLTFMYLANDVIQNSRKKGPEFTKEFGSCMKQACEIVASDADDKTWASLNRVLTIWGERNIYDSSQVTSFRQALGLRKIDKKNDVNANESQHKHKQNNNNNSNHKSEIKNNEGSSNEKHKKRDREKEKKEEKEREKEKGKLKSKDGMPPMKKRAISSTENKNAFASSYVQDKNVDKAKVTSSVVKKPVGSVVGIPPINNNAPLIEPDTLIKALQDLENSASADAAVREKIASLPPEVSDASLLEKIRDKGAAERLSRLVDEACTILADYNSRLSQELEERKQIATMLSNYTQNQRDALSLAEQKLAEFKDKLRKVTQVRNELKSHLQNLPDLSRLPSVTGLAPLPSACDLFNVNKAHGQRASKTGSLSSASPNESTASPADFESMLDIATPSSSTS